MLNDLGSVEPRYDEPLHYDQSPRYNERFSLSPVTVKYIKKNLDTVEPIDITKGQGTDKMCSLQSKVSLYRGSFSLTITGVRKTVRHTEDFCM